MSAIYDATSPDLSGFRARNRRLIVYHGWADAIVTPERTVQWFEQATQAAGGRAAMDGFARLFMIPGLDHCGLSPAGPGVSETGFDPLTALERWVEANEAPAQIMTNRPARDGQSAWSRPVCPWPQVARHRGGATTDGANFACVDPWASALASTRGDHSVPTMGMKAKPGAGGIALPPSPNTASPWPSG